jgi:anti-sigma factor RsiW
MRHVEGDLTAYLDGALGPAHRAEVESHLAGCSACRAERDRLAALIGAISKLPPPPDPSPGFARAFWARIDAEPPRRRGLLGILRSGRWTLVTPLAGAVAAAAVVLVVRQGHLRTEREIAERLDLFENYELVASIGAVQTAEDAEVVTHLDELEEGRP